MSTSKYTTTPARYEPKGLKSAVCPATKRLRGDPPLEITSVDMDNGRVYLRIGTAVTFVPVKRARDFCAAVSEALADAIAERDGE